MRVLVISDVHGNLAALEAVLEDAGRRGYDQAWCLGDVVGYGPEPNECIAEMRRLGAFTVVGNHDFAAIGEMDVADFNAEARRAVLWTRDQLTAASRRWLSDLPREPTSSEGVTTTHGSPRDPIWEYILHPQTAQANLSHFSTAVCLVGHTHAPAIFVRPAGDFDIRIAKVQTGIEFMWQRGERAIMNPGSVGQPRDSDPRAAYALLDTASHTWLPLRVAYPIETTQAHMRAARLPERLINRLAFGW
jgi:predicted phosphodiesterase